MIPSEILAVMIAWSFPFIIGGTLIYLIIKNWNDYRTLCYGFIGGYIWGLVMYVTTIPSMFA